MRPTLRFHPEAAEEMSEAATFYETRREGLGDRFLEAIHEVTDRLSAYPEVGTMVYGATRGIVLTGFPYTVFYRAGPTEIVVMSIAHARRRPFYWARRK